MGSEEKIEKKMGTDPIFFWQGEQRAQIWEGYAADGDSYWSRRAELVLSRLEKLGDEPGCSLDLGCGPGYLGARLAARGYRVYGVDLAEEMLARARRRVPAGRFAHGDEAHLPFAKQSFKLITAFSLLDYIQERPAYLARVIERLEPGGLFVLSTSNNTSIYVMLAIISRILRWPWHPEPEWYRTMLNLARTGIWSGGMVDLKRAVPIVGPLNLDHQLRHQGLVRVDYSGIFNCPPLDRPKYLNRLRESAWGGFCLRRLAWDYLGFYRKPGHRPVPKFKPKPKPRVKPC